MIAVMARGRDGDENCIERQLGYRMAKYVTCIEPVSTFRTIADGQVGVGKIVGTNGMGSPDLADTAVRCMTTPEISGWSRASPLLTTVSRGELHRICTESNRRHVLALSD